MWAGRVSLPEKEADMSGDTPGLPGFPKMPRWAFEEAKAGRAKLRLEAHERGEHEAAPSSLCTACK